MALDFDGVNDTVSYGDVNAIDGAADLTVMMWVNPDTLVTTTRYSIWGKPVGGSAIGWHFGQTSLGGILTFDGGNFATVAANTFAASTGVWKHHTFLFDGGGATNADKAKILINGVDQALTFTGSAPATLSNNASNFVISGLYDAFLDGKVAHVKVWTVTLTVAEVLQEMNSYRPVRTTNLLIWSPFDDSNARDYSGNGNHGTITEAQQISGPPVSYGG